MKNLITTVFVVLLLLVSGPIALAASYPANCPLVAQSIINSAGGCSAINCSQYGAICAKCCISASRPTSSQSSKSTMVVPKSLVPAVGSSSLPTSAPVSQPLSPSSLILFSIIGLVFWCGVGYIIWRLMRRKKERR